MKERYMKKTVLMFLLVLIGLSVSAQEQPLYNRNGDASMDALEYEDAKIYYEEGVMDYCDLYSIQRLTHIWRVVETMRWSLFPIMKRSLACLENKATQDSDTTCMRLLIEYYEKGIGTSVRKVKADSWKAELAKFQNVNQKNGRRNNTGQTTGSSEKMRFFAGYSGSYYVPYGLTVGGVAKIGWYVRFRTNFSSQNFTHRCDNQGNIINGLDNGIPDFLDNKKANVWAATGGMVFRVARPFYLSIGGGYVRRETLYQFEMIDLTVTEPKGTFWAKCEDETSFKGVALDLDGTFRIGKTFYLSMGCSMLNFKYVSANAGLGVFF